MVSRGQAKRADYILYCNPDIPLALIEPKSNSHNVGDAWQALNYVTTVDIPFVFSWNGDGFVFHDRSGGADGATETTLGLGAFRSSADLWARYRAWKGVTPEAEQIVLQVYFDDGSGNPAAVARCKPSVSTKAPIDILHNLAPRSKSGVILESSGTECSHE